MEVPQARNGWSGGLINLIPSTTGVWQYPYTQSHCDTHSLNSVHVAAELHAADTT